jgi:hypothetical protein
MRVNKKLWRSEDTVPIGSITSSDQTGSDIEVLTEPYGVTVEIGSWGGNEGLISLTKDEAKELRKLLKKAIKG